MNVGTRMAGWAPSGSAACSTPFVKTSYVEHGNARLYSVSLASRTRNTAALVSVLPTLELPNPPFENVVKCAESPPSCLPVQQLNPALHLMPIVLALRYALTSILLRCERPNVAFMNPRSFSVVRKRNVVA